MITIADNVDTILAAVIMATLFMAVVLVVGKIKAKKRRQEEEEKLMEWVEEHKDGIIVELMDTNRDRILKNESEKHEDQAWKKQIIERFTRVE